MKSLMKITSKKQDKTTHSFYFKLPNIFKGNVPQDIRISEYKNLIENFSLN